VGRARISQKNSAKFALIDNCHCDGAAESIRTKLACINAVLSNIQDVSASLRLFHDNSVSHKELSFTYLNYHPKNGSLNPLVCHLPQDLPEYGFSCCFNYLESWQLPTLAQNIAANFGYPGTDFVLSDREIFLPHPSSRRQGNGSPDANLCNPT
jgi:hypothetical protein